MCKCILQNNQTCQEKRKKVEFFNIPDGLYAESHFPMIKFGMNLIFP